MRNKLLKIGLTGGIATGKTTTSNQFAQHGIPIIDADVLAHHLVEPGQPALAKIVQIFGATMLNADGTLNRSRLRQQIFAEAKQRQHLEAILHPLIRQEMLRQLAELNTDYCILSIPLLLETQQMDMVDRVLVVDCSLASQRQRLKARNNFTEAEIDQILMAQSDREARLAIANDVIYNDTDLNGLRTQVEALHQFYSALRSATN
jgi:dephospho-CoA kinase